MRARQHREDQAFAHILGEGEGLPRIRRQRVVLQVPAGEGAYLSRGGIRILAIIERERGLRIAQPIAQRGSRQPHAAVRIQLTRQELRQDGILLHRLH